MALVQIREYDSLSISDKSGEFTLSPHQAELLAKKEQSLPKGAIKWGHNSVKFSQYCGVISLGSDVIEILPKIYGKGESTGSTRSILIQMLYAARRLKAPSMGHASISIQKHHLLDVFIQHFCEELFKQLREGMIRVYINQIENLPVLRGKLLINQHLRSNVVHKERMYCEFDELVENNPYNQILKYTLRILNRLAFSGQVKRSVTELLYRFDEIDDATFTADSINSLYMDRATNRFEYIFEQCKWFIQGNGQDVVAGENSSMSLLFDMNRLFEEFVAAKLKRAAWAHGYKLQEQRPQKYLLREVDSNATLFLMKPDITLSDESGTVVYIMDTKWKLLDQSDSKFGISQSDLYQMAAYAMAYDCNKINLIYPRQQGFSSAKHFSVLNNPDLKISAHCIDIENLARNSSYADHVMDLLIGL